MTLKRYGKSKIKQLCCVDDLSVHGKTEILGPLVSTQVLAVEKIKREISDGLE